MNVNSISKIVVVYNDDKIFQFGVLQEVVAFYELSKFLSPEEAFENSKKVVEVWATTPNTPNVERVSYLYWEAIAHDCKDLEKITKYIIKNY